MLIFGGYFKVRILVYPSSIWVITILNHIDTKAILPKYKDSCMVYRPKWY